MQRSTFSQADEIAKSQPSPVFERQTQPTPPNEIDHVVYPRLKQMGLQAALPCSDAVFGRRVCLDVIGTLPSAEEAGQFLDDPNPNKRSALIDHLLERDEFVDYWAMKWSDLLRVKAEFPINLWPNAAQAYYRWIHDGIQKNKPYHQFVWELLTSSGSNFRTPAVNFYRALQSNSPQDIARAVALTFMGVHADQWPKNQLDGMAVCFSCVGYKSTQEWKEEVIYFDTIKASADAASGALGKAVFPDGQPAMLTGQEDPRWVFAQWLTAPTNAWFLRCIVNRAWYWFFGRGVVHEPDDLHPGNPASHPDLLTLLEKKLTEFKYDLKQLFRLILNSQTYQQSPIPRTNRPEVNTHFASYPLRRLDAEVLIDALCQITGTTESYSSMIPEPFTFIPEGRRSITLPDGSITSPFLEMFGRPPRDTGLESERNNNPTASQRLHLLNSSHVREKIEQSPHLQRKMATYRNTPQQGVDNLYLSILSRRPTAEERASIRQYMQNRSGGGRVYADLVWALINSTEFLYRH